MLEIEELFQGLKEHDPTKKDRAFQRLLYLEETGGLPLEALMEWGKVYRKDSIILQYLIDALARKESAEAYPYLIDLYKEQTDLFVLLGLLKVFEYLPTEAFEEAILAKIHPKKPGFFQKAFGKKEEEQDLFDEKELIEELLIPSLQVLRRSLQTSNLPKLTPYFKHPDPLVRYQTMMVFRDNGHTIPQDSLSELLKDNSPLNKEQAEIMQEMQKRNRLETLARNPMNNISPLTDRLEAFLAGKDMPLALKNCSIEDLESLAEMVRERIIQVTSQVGGHLASSLGTVDLTLALYHVFNPAEHAIVWDVGHQAYTHKIVTGRNHDFAKIGKRGGIAKFLRQAESHYDVFGAGHASTSISAALGVAIAEQIKQGEAAKKVVAVIGDGALTGGLAFEALNHLGHLKKNLLVILNDNSMSIGHNIGGLARTFNAIQTHKAYNELRAKLKFWDRSKKLPHSLISLLKRTNDSVMEFLSPKSWVETLGLRYLGPFDGHNIQDLVEVFQKVHESAEPLVIHLRTVKGKGFVQAEKDSIAYHGVSGFNREDGRLKMSSATTYTKVWSEAFQKIFEHDPKVVAISAAMIESVGLQELYAKHPMRIFDVGIAEAHAVCMAGGMAKGGLKPFVAIYSTFLQRAYDQLIHDVGLQNLPVKFVLDRAGFVGADGATHNGVFDLSYLRLIPNYVVMAPRNAEQLSRMVVAAYLYDQGPIAVRFPRGEVTAYRAMDDGFWQEALSHPLAIGKAEIISQGKDLAILSLGTVFDLAAELAELFRKDGWSPSLVDMRFVKPLDEDCLQNLALNHQHFITLEENTKLGGFGSAVLEFFQRRGLEKQVSLFGIEDRFIEYGTPDEQRKEVGLDAASIKQQVLSVLKPR